MKTRASTYFVNLAGPSGVETIDEYEGSRDGAEHLLGEYRLVYWRTESHVYLSRRPTRDWRDRS